MSLFKRGLNVISGSISQIKKSNSPEQRKKEQMLERELRGEVPGYVPRTKSTPDHSEISSTTPDSSEESKPLQPKKRTI